MPDAPRERRKHARYETKAEIYFRVSYKISTRVKFQVHKQGKRFGRKYAAISKNVSAEGLSFVSKKQVLKGDQLYVELYLPKIAKPIIMEGEVRWCLSLAGNKKKIFEVGLKILTVEGQHVDKSVYYDKMYHVIWSILLESVLGNFRIISGKLASQRRNS